MPVPAFCQSSITSAAHSCKVTSNSCTRPNLHRRVIIHETVLYVFCLLRAKRLTFGFHTACGKYKDVELMISLIRLAASFLPHIKPKGCLENKISATKAYSSKRNKIRTYIPTHTHVHIGLADIDSLSGKRKRCGECSGIRRSLWLAWKIRRVQPLPVWFLQYIYIYIEKKFSAAFR